MAKAGIHHPEIAHGGKHLQLRWTTPRGERRVFAVPDTPSDWRSAENTRHDLRRILRDDGMLETAAAPDFNEPTVNPYLPLEKSPAESELTK